MSNRPALPAKEACSMTGELQLLHRAGSKSTWKPYFFWLSGPYLYYNEKADVSS